ncbi:hypothetical protein DM860_003574 [Cuscuta australis]|uniref:Uncharacterized protein n=1 Tax=Cuscuta australis TaxID=267555 RepID=A0A328DG95_9ASTE|nr:hypothetical protein DM860_003574 [Cuscuta australis]
MDIHKQGSCVAKMKGFPLMGIIFIVMLFFVYRTTDFQYQWTQHSSMASKRLKHLPHRASEPRSDLELKPPWSMSSSKVDVPGAHNLLAMPVGIKQKDNVDKIAQKFLSENFTIILFHYDGNVSGWWDLAWTKTAIHIVAHNQTK